jgi:hypothetical protein
MSRMKIVAYTCLTVLVVSTAFWGCFKRDSSSSAPGSNIDFTSADAIRASGAFGVYEDGWMGKEANIVLGNLAHQPAILLEGTNVQTKPGDEALWILLLVGPDTVQTLRIMSVGDFHEMAILPQKIRAYDTLEIRLITTKIFVPSELGTSKDDRSLSFRLKSVSLVALESARSSIPTAFEFPRTDETDPNLQGIYSDGWIGDSASVTLFNLDNKAAVEIRGLVPGSIFQGVATLDVLFEGELLVRQQVSDNFRMTFQLPEKARGAAKFTLALRPIGVFVPSDRGISSDKRRISYQLRYIGLR